MKFFNWLGNLTSIIKEDGPDSPYSMRRVALMADIFAGAISLEKGFFSAFMAAANGASWLVVAVFFAPFVFCVIAAWSIIANLTATDVQQIISATKDKG